MTHGEALRLAIARLEDLLKGDDGQAWKEAEKELPRLRVALAQPVASEGSGIVGYVFKSGHGTAFAEKLHPDHAALMHGNVPMWRPVVFATAQPAPAPSDSLCGKWVPQ